MAEQQVSVDEAWATHRRWSQVADAAHTRIDNWRRLNLSLLIAAAVAGALGGLIDHAPTQRGLAGVAAGLLAVAAFVQGKLSETAISEWIDTRLASERIKGAVYRSLVSSGPGGDALLWASIEEAEGDAQQHLLAFGSTVADGEPVPPVTDLDSYVAERAREQADWHRGKLGGLKRKGSQLRRIELVLTGLGVIASAVAAATDVSRLAAVVTLLTTAAAVVAAHIGATKYERVASGYARTVNRIDRALHRLPDQPTDDEAFAFVDEVEHVLAQQNESWSAINSPS